MNEEVEEDIDKKENSVEEPALSAEEEQPKKKIPGRPFVKGQSGNPAGRPKGSVSITAAIKAKLVELYPDPNDLEAKKTYLEQFVEVIFDNALYDRDPATLKAIWNYIDGMPKATLGVEADREQLESLTEFFRVIGTKPKEIDEPKP